LFLALRQPLAAAVRQADAIRDRICDQIVAAMA
jgi:hypothetical protein